jgi:hypothetical protein
MASHIEAVAECKKFSVAIDGLANDGAFSPDEREGFALLFLKYNKALTSFQFAPAHGDASPLYDLPMATATQGVAVAAAAMPGNIASQQPVYDAVHKGAAELAAVTRAQLRPRLRAR